MLLAFGIERVAIRTCVLCAILFCALTVPDFGPFMNLVGSSTIPLVCAVLPTVCNLYLNAMTFDGNTKQYHIPTLRECVIIIRVSVCSLVIGLISAALSIHEITLVNFTPPCYLRKILLPSDENSVNHELINCCGLNRDIYLYGNATEICR
ncbi:unnamed protein product [Anisakis simplex]|uniref:Aa_trans domain-containing protein n=1 Tax=Anisakis simplex TaxID=6269 RepID=A0A0M3KHT7_ANISI|nr:unnamed protein product [Anisakis simplex]